MTYPLDDLAGYVNAYRAAKAQYARHLDEASRWKKAMTSIGSVIENRLTENAGDTVDNKTTWLGTVDGVECCRLIRYPVREFDIAAFREKEPELAERYTRRPGRTKLTFTD